MEEHISAYQRAVEGLHQLESSLLLQLIREEFQIAAEEFAKMAHLGSYAKHARIAETTLHIVNMYLSSESSQAEEPIREVISLLQRISGV